MFSARALVLLVVVGIAFALLAPTVRSFIAQRASLEQLQREVAAARERDEDLVAELARWEDPSYVAAQARERLTYVMPGEVAYRVVDPEIARAVEAAAAAEELAAEAEAARTGSVVEGTSASPWYATLWGSVVAAGEFEVGAPSEERGGADSPGTGTKTSKDTGEAETPAPTTDKEPAQ